MPTKPFTIDDKDFYGDLCNPAKFMGKQDGYEYIHHFPCEICNGFCYSIKLRPGLSLSIFNHQSTRPYLLNYQDPGNRFAMLFTLPDAAGNHSSVSAHNNHPQSHTDDTEGCFLGYMPEGCGVITRPEPISFRGIFIEVELWLMKQFCEDCDSQIPDDLNSVLGASSFNYSFKKSLNLTPTINLRLHEILNCRYQGSSRRFFLESKALELFVHGFEQLKCNTRRNRDTYPFGIHTNDFIIQTQEILLGNMAAPPSLTEIARQVGVNKTKLNQCFRKVHGVSVFEYLRICRLEKAKDLLICGEKTVTEIALDVGYNHHCNFTTEFKKYFGVNPITYRK